MNARSDHVAFEPAPTEFAFDAAVVLTMDGQVQFIEDAAQARRCLVDRFPDADGPSFKRAMTACDDCLLGRGSGAAARIMFVVAAMEAGFPFEVIDDPGRALERRTDLAAEAGLLSILSDEPAELDAAPHVRRREQE